MASDSVQGGVIGSPIDLHEGEFVAPLQITLGAFLQERIPKHGAEAWGEGEGDLEWDLLGDHPAKHLQEGNITLRYGLVEPILLQKFLVFRVPHPWQMGVEK